MEYTEQLESWNNYNNLAETKARRSEKIICACGMSIIRGKKAQHEKTKIHKLFFTNPEEHAKKMKEKEERDKVPKWTCECGAKINISQTKGAKGKHKRSKPHLEWEKQQQK